MDHKVENQDQVQAAAIAYEAPRVETVLSAEELEREVFYAGGDTPSGGPPPPLPP